MNYVILFRTKKIIFPTLRLCAGKIVTTIRAFGFSRQRRFPVWGFHRSTVQNVETSQAKRVEENKITTFTGSSLFSVGFCYLILFNAFSWLYFNLRLSFQHLTANQENPSLNYRYYVKHLLTISKLMGVKTQRKTFFDFLNFSSLWSNWHLLLFDFFFYLDSTAPDDKDFLHRSILRTDHFQASLPRLPVPELEDTLKKYLESQRQILTDAEYDQTVDIVNKFKATDGPGTIVC